MFYTYGILRPNKEVFYIGKALNTVERLSGHIRDAKNYANENPHKEAVIRQILSLGLTPKIKILYRAKSEEKAFAKEVKLIAYYRKLLGDKLTNIALGGEGPRPVESTKKKMKHRALSYYKKHPEARKAISERRKLYWTNPKNRLKAREIQKKIQGTPKAKQRARNEKLGKKNPMYGVTPSQESIRKRVEKTSGPLNVNWGKPQSPKTLRKNSESNKRTQNLPSVKEHNRKMQKIIQNRPEVKEHNRKMQILRHQIKILHSV